MYKFLPNYDVHPTKSNYMVFTFRKDDMAEYFTKELNLKGIKFETSVEKGRNGLIHFFGVAKSDFDEVYQLNLITHGKHRKPYFANKYLKIILMTLLTSLIVLAIIGYIKN